MKKLYSLVIFFMCLLFGQFSAQTLQIAVPASVCAGQTNTAAVSVTNLSITAYTWTINPPAVFNQSSSIPFNSISITFTGCGTHTVTVYAYSGPVLTGSASETINVICPGVLVVPPTQTVCTGSYASLYAVGFGSFTWSTTQTTPIINPMPLSTTVYSAAWSINGCIGTATVYVGSPPIIGSTGSAVCANSTITLTAFGSGNYTWTGSSLPNPVIQPSIAVGPGIYTVSTAPGSTLCSASTTVVTAPPLNLNVSLSTPTTCIETNYPDKLSKPVIITLTGAQTYSWVPSLPVIPPLGNPRTVRPPVSTCYTVVGLTPNCSATAVVCVSVIPQFTFDVKHKGILCRFWNETMSITNISTMATGPSTAFSYYWNFPPALLVSSSVTPSVIVTPTLTFTYTVEVFDAAGCAASAKQGTAFVTGECVSIKSFEDDNELFSLYPNPVGETLTIKAKKNTVNDPGVEIIDLVGKKITISDLQYQAAENSWRLDLKNLGPGIYFIKLFSEDKILQTSKVIKQ